MPLLIKSEQDQLKQLLLQLPGIANPNNRYLLLDGLPPALSLGVNLGNAPITDINLIVSTIDSQGALLANGSWPIIIVIENAIRSAVGLDLELQLRQLLTLSTARKDARAEKGVELEAIINQQAHFVDVGEWSRRFNEILPTICLIEGAKLGTGFLLGPDLIITNYHVVDIELGEPARFSQVNALFDFVIDANGKRTSGKPYKVKVVPGEDLPRSPFGELDFALLRLEGSPGEGRIGDLPNAPKRRWLKPVEASLAADQPLFVIQHPNGRPMQIAFDVVTGTAANPSRVLYRTNTEGGSSGSPCFNEKWELVALHHAYNNALVPPRNQGVPFRDILSDPKVRAVLPA